MAERMIHLPEDTYRAVLRKAWDRGYDTACSDHHPGESDHNPPGKEADVAQLAAATREDEDVAP